jgi:hypothetical protein
MKCLRAATVGRRPSLPQHMQSQVRPAGPSVYSVSSGANASRSRSGPRGHSANSATFPPGSKAHTPGRGGSQSRPRLLQSTLRFEGTPPERTPANLVAEAPTRGADFSATGTLACALTSTLLNSRRNRSRNKITQRHTVGTWTQLTTPFA